MQELRLVAVSEDGTYLVLATAGRGTRFTLPVDDRLRAAVRGNFSRLGQYEIEVESPLRPKEIQARIRAGETAEEIAATAGIPVERVRWFEGPVLQEREYMAQQAQRVSVRMPGETTPGPTLGELVAERLTRRGVPADEIDWDSAKRDDNLWRVRLGFVWNGHTRHAEWLFDPRRRHITPNDDEAMRLSAAEYVEPERDDATVRPFVPRLASKLAPVPSLPAETSSRRDEPGLGVPAVRSEPAALPEPVPPPRLSPPLRAESGRPERPEPYADEPAAYRPELTPVPFRLPQSLVAGPDVVPPPPGAETRVESPAQTGSAVEAAPPRTPADAAPATTGVPPAPGPDAAGDGAVWGDGQDTVVWQAASQPSAHAVTPAPVPAPVPMPTPTPTPTAEAAAPGAVTGGNGAAAETAGATRPGETTDAQEAARPATPVERAAPEDSTTTTSTTVTPDSGLDSAVDSTVVSTAESGTASAAATDDVAAVASSRDAEDRASNRESAEATVGATVETAADTP
ncbi:septation protein SepH, partial [Microbispora rosea]